MRMTILHTERQPCFYSPFLFFSLLTVPKKLPSSLEPRIWIARYWGGYSCSRHSRGPFVDRSSADRGCLATLDPKSRSDKTDEVVTPPTGSCDVLLHFLIKSSSASSSSPWCERAASRPPSQSFPATSSQASLFPSGGEVRPLPLPPRHLQPLLRRLPLHLRRHQATPPRDRATSPVEQRGHSRELPLTPSAASTARRTWDFPHRSFQRVSRVAMDVPSLYPRRPRQQIRHYSTSASDVARTGSS